MSKRNRDSIRNTWLAFITASILLAVSIAWAELRNSEPSVANEYETSRYADRAQDRIKRICVNMTGLDLLHCEYEVEQPERENYRAQKDLRAQWYMAVWAGVMALFTFGTLIVTGLGVYFVRQTLIQTSKTNDAAIGAAMAAAEANLIMRDDSAGYLIIESVEVQTQTIGVLVKMTVKNIGQRPVRRARASGIVSFVWGAGSGEIIPSIQSARGKAEPFVGVVEPGQSATGFDVVSFDKFAVEREVYDTKIMANPSADFDCKLVWDDDKSLTGSERHILSPNKGRSFFDKQGPEVISLIVSYSGMHKIWEDRNAKGGES